MAFVKSNKTQIQLLVSYLRGTGRTITSRKADALFGVKNLRARMTELRQAGFKVYTSLNLEGRTKYYVSRRKMGQA